MAKPNERNKRMETLADQAIEGELDRLKERQRQLREVAVKLDDIRWTVDEFSQSANRFIGEQDSSRAWLIRTLGISRREATLIWPAKRHEDKTENPTGRMQEQPTADDYHGGKESSGKDPAWRH